MLVARTLRAILRTDAAALLQRLESDEPVSSGDMCGVQELEKTRNGIRLRLVNKLAAAMAEVSKDKGFNEKTTSLGIVPTARGPKEFAAFIKEEVDTNTALLKDAGFKPE